MLNTDIYGNIYHQYTPVLLAFTYIYHQSTAGLLASLLPYHTYGSVMVTFTYIYHQSTAGLLASILPLTYIHGSVLGFCLEFRDFPAIRKPLGFPIAAWMIGAFRVLDSVQLHRKKPDDAQQPQC